MILYWYGTAKLEINFDATQRRTPPKPLVFSFLSLPSCCKHGLRGKFCKGAVLMLKSDGLCHSMSSYVSYSKSWSQATNWPIHIWRFYRPLVHPACLPNCEVVDFDPLYVRPTMKDKAVESDSEDLGASQAQFVFSWHYGLKALLEMCRRCLTPSEINEIRLGWPFVEIILRLGILKFYRKNAQKYPNKIDMIHWGEDVTRQSTLRSWTATPIPGVPCPPNRHLVESWIYSCELFWSCRHLCTKFRLIISTPLYTRLFCNVDVEIKVWQPTKRRFLVSLCSRLQGTLHERHLRNMEKYMSEVESPDWLLQTVSFLTFFFVTFGCFALRARVKMKCPANARNSPDVLCLNTACKRVAFERKQDQRST